MNRIFAAPLVFAGAVAALGGCGTTTAGTPVTVVREIVPPPATTTAVVPPPATSVVVAEPPVTVTRAPSLTSCQRLSAEGFSCTYAYNAWVTAGRPLSRDADRDGYSC
ncbi:hypothetical protein ACFWIW_30655 [Amycolatopsis sp. NPDC058340]|uniref:hypothetical protein n=1 Tax=Amycolatopsis sp. NPDC058340 TaxID=3346453 RepID=UPI0036634969